MLEMVCTFFESNARVELMIAGRLTKAKNKKMFFESCFNYFLLSLSFFFAAEIIRFLRLIRSLYNAKFSPSLFGL
jgi:hypothetical protein